LPDTPAMPTISPAPQHGKAVAERLHLAELVGNHQDGDLLAFGHAAQKGQHLVRFARGHHRGRLIEDQEPLVEIQKLEDLQLLLLARRQVRDLAVQPHPERHPVHERLQRPLLGAPVDDARRIGAGHDQIFGRRQAGHQREMLVDHADPLRLRLPGAVQRYAHTIKEDRTRIRAVKAHDALDQRGLAGAVLAQKGMEGPGGNLHRHLVQRAHRAEDLGDALGRQRQDAGARRSIRGQDDLAHLGPVISRWTIRAALPARRISNGPRRS